MTLDLMAAAKDRGIRYFLIAFADLFGVMRAKLVPVEAIGAMEKAGAGFAGFSTWLDMSPADADMQAIPEPASLMQLPWKPEVGWLAADLGMGGEPVAQGPRTVLKRRIAAAADLGLVENRRRVRVLPAGPRDEHRRRYRGPRRQTLLRSRRVDAPLRPDQRNLRCHAEFGLESLSKRP